MKIVEPGFEILTNINGNRILKSIEMKARVCYKSEDRITDDSCVKFVKMLVDRGHEAMIEHESISVKVICDRGVSHEIVRHRLASYAQESTRYCNYGNKDIEFITPFVLHDSYSAKRWRMSMALAEEAYRAMIDDGCSPQIARSVLPNSLKTEIVITMNLREWKHFFKMRADKAAHPQMRQIAVPMLKEFKRLIPIIFDDLGES